MANVCCPSCQTENEVGRSGAPFFCRGCKTIVDPKGSTRTVVPAPPTKSYAPPTESASYVSRYSSHAPRDTAGPGASASVGGSVILGLVLATLVGAVGSAVFAYVGAHYLQVPFVSALVIGWLMRRAQALGSGGGTPDRGAVGSFVLGIIVLGCFGTARFVEYRAVAVRESAHVHAVFGDAPLEDVETVIQRIKGLDVDRDGIVVVPEDGSTVNVADEEQRLRAAKVTGKHADEPYDIVLLAAEGQKGFLGHVKYVLDQGMTFRFLPHAHGIDLPGGLIDVWWFLEVALLGFCAFYRVE